MSLKTIVKVSHISNLSDARYCAGMGVELLGFQVTPGSENFMSVQVFQDIRGWISGPRIIAEVYGLAEAGQLEVIMRDYGPDYLEMSLPEFIAFRHALTVPAIVHFSDPAEMRAVDGDERIAYAVVNADAHCRDIGTPSFPVLVQVRSEDESSEKLSQECFRGVVLEGSKEIRPGITGYEQLGSILEALEED
jgi:phosphoribosylanthranilate isomerase